MKPSLIRRNSSAAFTEKRLRSCQLRSKSSSDKGTRGFIQSADFKKELLFIDFPRYIHSITLGGSGNSNMFTAPY